jgi:hypothetical protein
MSEPWDPSCRETVPPWRAARTKGANRAEHLKQKLSTHQQAAHAGQFDAQCAACTSLKKQLDSVATSC